jgi:hypothetical protein
MLSRQIGGDQAEREDETKTSRKRTTAGRKVGSLRNKRIENESRKAFKGQRIFVGGVT